MFGDGTLEQRDAEAVKFHIELVVFGDQCALLRRDFFILLALGSLTDGGIIRHFPAEQDFGQRQRLLKAFCQTNQAEVPSEIRLRDIERFGGTGTTVKVVRRHDRIKMIIAMHLKTGNRLRLRIIIRNFGKILLKPQTFCVTIRDWMGSAMPPVIILRERPAYWVSQNRDVGRRLRYEPMQAERN